MNSSNQDTKYRAIFIAIMIVTFMIGFDTTGLGIAIPVIATELGFGVKEGAWLSISYTAGFAAFLLPAGIITDRLGAMRTLISALLVFVVASYMSVSCVSLGSFTFVRLIQGIAAAFLNTAAMALLNLLFPVGSGNRSQVFKTWSMILGLSFSLGPPLGGLIIRTLDWSWILLLNLPLGGLVVFLMLKRKGRTLSAGGTLSRVSLFSTLPVTAILLLVTMYQYIDQMLPSQNGTIIKATLLILGAVSVWLCHHFSARSFTRLPELKNGAFLISLVLPIIFSIAYWSLFVVLPQYFAVKLGFGALYLVMTMLLLSLPLTLVPLLRIAERFNLQATEGFLMLTVGLVLLAGIFSPVVDGNVWLLGVGLLLLGTGAAVLNPLMARLVMDNVAPENSGLAAALTSTLRQTGFAAGVAFFSLLTQHSGKPVIYISEAMALLIAAMLSLVALVVCQGLQRSRGY
ncbi:MFS transporter [Photorhabdus bodei]|uniref:MFS transporter n=1 Tax=Photorhabdus bodei TaxID=2029681 RepID=A0A329XAT4_9GAMM|nr:MFS transporter [Photorhabdus bodei]NDK98514.1 MFS transporter [Photorhabdus bodei]NDL02766.1 MFS transporter [Photorhabdus bodei]NDL06971.1 MFS transporter [Photorhabdus bodei]RAX13937.1 hypothetical protein CKY02_03760 [Photorhabdus bodei]